MNQKSKDNSKIILILIVSLGILLRIGFAFAVNIDNYQYDLAFNGEIFKTDNKLEVYDKVFELDRDYIKEGGHLEYILTIYKTGHLPDSNLNQFYHPPFAHIMFAIFMKLVSIFTTNTEILLESLEFLAIIYSVLTIYVLYKIIKELGFTDRQSILPISILTFHPLFIFLSRMINTDGLVSLLLAISLLYLIRWKKNPSYKNVIILGLAIGLGGMTKTSVIVMAVPLFVAYLKKLEASVDDTKLVKKILIQGLLFTLITLPLIFWFQIRNTIKFNQGFFSVVTALDELKVENNSFSARWILNKELFNRV